MIHKQTGAPFQLYFSTKVKFTISIFANLKCLGIFAPLYNYAVKLNIKISKKVIIRLVLFTALVVVASLLDNYLENNSVQITQDQTNSNHSASEHGTIYLFSQANYTFNAKPSVQKAPLRKLFEQSHDKFLQKYHQLRNFQVLKADAKTHKIPLFLSYHYLMFRNYYYTVPDDDPLLS